MQCTTTNSRLTDCRSDVGIILVSENPDLDAMPASTAPHLRKLLELGGFTGQFGTSSLVYTNDDKIPRLLFVGTGKPEETDLERIRQSHAHGARTVSEAGFTSAVIPVPSSATPEEIEAAATAIPLSLYQFHRYKTKLSETDKKLLNLTSVTFLTENAQRQAMVERAVERGNIYTKGIILTRDLSNEPGNYMTPTRLAEVAEEVAAESGLTCQIYDKAMLQKHGFGGILAVSQGSIQEPRFIVLEYFPDGGYSGTVVFIGKSISYDTGGVNLKPADGLIGMKGDMSGGAAVIGAMQSIGQLKPKNLRVIGLLPAAENHVGPDALKPDDIITTYSENTVEVVNTDAEGRIVLADAHHFAAQYKPDGVVNLATLTGAALVALGWRAAPAMTNNPELLSRVKAASVKTHERIAELPLWDDYDEDVKSKIADIKNLGDGRNAGTIAGAAFLKFFVNNAYPWVHLDIAGTAWDVKHSNYIPESGASGWGASLLTRLVEDWHTDR